MPPPTAKPRKTSGSRFGLSTRATEPGHERLLVAVKRHLPGLLRDSVQSERPLNDAIDGVRGKWRARIESLIASKHLTGTQAARWREVPNIQYRPPAFDLAAIRFGQDLLLRRDARGERKAVPSVIYTSDFEAVFDAQCCSIYLCDDSGSSFPEKPIVKPSDAVSLSCSVQRFSLQGCAFPASTMLGLAADEMAQLVGAASQHFNDRFSVAPTPVMFATDRGELYDMLIEQYDGMLISSVDDTVIEFDFGLLHNDVGLTQAF